jgi:hypothetical protein
MRLSEEYLLCFASRHLFIEVLIVSLEISEIDVPCSLLSFVIGVVYKVLVLWWKCVKSGWLCHSGVVDLWPSRM